VTAAGSGVEAGSTGSARGALGLVAVLVLVLAVGLTLALSGWLRASAAEEDRENVAAALDTQDAREEDLAEALADRRLQLNSAQGERRRLDAAVVELVTAGEAFGAAMREVTSIPRGMVAAVRAEDAAAYNEARDRVLAAQSRMLVAAEQHRVANVRLSSLIQVLEEVTR